MWGVYPPPPPPSFYDHWSSRSSNNSSAANKYSCPYSSHLPPLPQHRSNSLSSMSPASHRRYSSGSGGAAAEMVFDHVQIQQPATATGGTNTQQQLLHILPKPQLQLQMQQMQQQSGGARAPPQQQGTYYQVSAATILAQMLRTEFPTPIREVTRSNLGDLEIRYILRSFLLLSFLENAGTQ